jgi:uncharacterized protein
MAAEASRIAALDALRGAGILGVLLVHVQLFAMPVAARSNPTVYGDVHGADGAVWLATRLLADGKFIAIFALLFGAGIAISADRREAEGTPAAPLHYRRMAALFLVGVLHAYLLWHGDMLVTLALCGALVFPHRGRSAGWLMAAGVAMLAVAPLLTLALAWAAPEALAQAEAFWRPSAGAVSREIAAYRGGWLLQQTHRAPTAWALQTSSLALRDVWQTSGLMLLGMGVVRTGALTGERPARWHGVLAATGLALGVPLSVWAVQRSAARGWEFRDFVLVGSHLHYVGSLLVGGAWIGAILLLHHRGLLPAAVRAVGRTALSNYLLATLLCTTVFYGHGLGLFGSVDRLGQLLVVALVWATQCSLTTWWLARFDAGPLEWMVRSLTRGRGTPGPLDDGRPRA